MMDTCPPPVIQGNWDEDFAPLIDVFRTNFTERGEVGASLCVLLNGEPVVDVWAGIADRDSGKAWERDTIGIVFSNTKPATALCLHLLADKGLLTLDDYVARYWTAFGTAGKEHTTLRMLLDHSAGLPALRDPLPDGAAFDWQEMTSRLAAEQPFWKPGTRVGYHGLTFGWLVGEVVRQVTGQSVGNFFRQEIARPLGLDFWIGLPDEEESRIAPVIPFRPAQNAPQGAFERALAEEPDSASSLYFRNTGGWRPSGFNSRRGRAAEIPAANGITNARGLAGLYASLAGGKIETNSGELLSGKTLADAMQVTSATHEDVVLRVPTRFAAGFMRSMDNRGRNLDSVVLPGNAFGHVGAGGSLGFADPARGLAFGYTMNRMGAGVLLNERGQSLVDSLSRTGGRNTDWNSELPRFSRTV